jgi:hypothetical protein
MRRTESEESLVALFANFGDSCRSLLSTSVLEEDSLISELDQSLTGITDVSSKNNGPNRELVRLGGSRRQLIGRAQSERTFGASYGAFGASCSSLLSIPWESLHEHGDAGSIVSGYVPSLSNLGDSSTNHSRRAPMRTTDVPPKSLGLSLESCVSQLTFCSIRADGSVSNDLDTNSWFRSRE